MPNVIRKSFEVETKDLGDGIIESIIATESIDRGGESLSLDGLDITNYLKNPVVAWAHKYDQPPIGMNVGIYKQDGKLYARTKYARDIYPFADLIYKLKAAGYLRASSIGFIPIEENGVTYTKSEMIEYSDVLIPQNAEALQVAKTMGLDIDLIDKVEKGLIDIGIIKGMVPANMSDMMADIDMEWSAPNLKDFTDKSWEDLTSGEKRKIASHFAWVEEMPPANFGQMKLPHHDPVNNKAVFKGIASAVAALNGARGGVQIPAQDREKVYAHLVAHYKMFDKTPPELKSYDTINNYIEIIKNATSAMESILGSDETESSDLQSKSGRRVKKVTYKVKLSRAKRNAQIIDKASEIILAELREKLRG